jgi:hypothetical protein
MTTSPITLPVLCLILLSLTLAFCAGKYAEGLWMPVMLIGSGIVAVCAVFIEASEAYAAGVESEDQE